MHQLVRKFLKHRERLIDNDPRDFPMPGGGVFAGGAFLHFAEAGEDRQRRLLVRPRIVGVQNFRQSKRAQIGQLQIWHAGKDVAEGVGAFIAVFRRVGRVTNADRIENKKERAHQAFVE